MPRDRLSVEANKFTSRAEISFASFNTARHAVRDEESIDRKAMCWSSAINEYCKTTKFMSEAARRMGRNAWADALFREQKQSQALNYLLHARNADNHGLEEVTADRAGQLHIGGFLTVAGDCENIVIKDCVEIVRLPVGGEVKRTINGSFSTKDGMLSDGWLASGVPISHTPRHLRLLPVYDRGITYPVPNLPCVDNEAANEVLQRAYNWLDSKLRALRT